MQDSRTDRFLSFTHHLKEPNEMNSKIANLIALELGILIAIMAWLAFSSHSSVKQHRGAEEQERPAGSFATVAPVLRSRNQPLYAADYRADPAGGQMEDEEQTQTLRQYDQGIATEPSASSDPAGDVITGSSPYYAGVGQEPVAYAPDCFVSPLDQIVECPQPNEIIVFSNVRFFGHRHRPTARFDGQRMMVAQRRLGGGEPHARGGGLVSPRNTHPRSVSTRPGNQGSRKSLAR
jgi:hypothetical protein